MTAIFLGRPICSLSPTFPVIWNFNWETVLSSHFKSCCIFVLQNISLKFPYGTPYPDQSNLACLEQTPIFHCSKVEAHRCCLSGTNWTPVYQHLGFQNLKPTVNSWISCLAVAEKIWQVFPLAQPMYSTQSPNAFSLQIWHQLFPRSIVTTKK